MSKETNNLIFNIKKNKIAYLLITPNMIFFIIFLLIPFFWIILLSFQKGGILEPKVFIGLKNYESLLTNKIFLKSILNTLEYIAIVIPLVFVISMVVALLLNSIKRFQNFFRALLFVPLLNSAVVAAIIFQFLLYPDYGPLSIILKFLHFPVINWFGNAKVTLFTIALIELWKGAPFYIVTFLAGLQGVPKDLTEASYIDGANYFQTLFKVVFPSMKPVLTFCLVMATIWNLQIFDSIYVLTRGGPANASSTMVWYIYENIFFFNKVGRGATMSVVLILLTAIMTFINLRITKFQEQVLKN
jgi:ABC-type sugar transport system permease subunit